MNLKTERIDGDWCVVDYANVRGSSAPTVVEVGYPAKILAQARVGEINQRGYYFERESGVKRT